MGEDSHLAKRSPASNCPPVGEPLTVSEYDQAEQLAIAELPNRIIEAFQPITFAATGYPSRIRHEMEMVKFIDVMHEGRFESEFEQLFGSLTSDEFDVLRQIATKVLRMCEIRFGRRHVPRSSLLRMINVSRHIRYVGGGRRLRILEIGPGCGYLGALLMAEGHKYVGTDVSQAFYLLQNHLWMYLSEGRLNERVRCSQEGRSAEASQSVHVPWWDFVRWRPESAPSMDIVTCNHALSEMHPLSLAFVLTMARACLRDDGKSPKALVFEGWGSSRLNSHAAVAEALYRAGFVLLQNDQWITVLVLANSALTAGSACLPRPTATKVVSFRNLLRRAAILAPVSTQSFDPPVYVAPENPLTTAIATGRAADHSRRTVSLSHVNEFYVDLLGGDDPRSMDERFLDVVKL